MAQHVFSLKMKVNLDYFHDEHRMNILEREKKKPSELQG